MLLHCVDLAEIRERYMFRLLLFMNTCMEDYFAFRKETNYVFHKLCKSQIVYIYIFRPCCVLNVSRFVAYDLITFACLGIIVNWVI